MIEIELSSEAISKIKAIGALTGKNPKQISQFVSKIVEDRLNNVGSIVENALAGLPVTVATAGLVSPLPAIENKSQVPSQTEQYNVDTTGISEGLGEEDNFDIDPEIIPPETDPMAFVPKDQTVVHNDDEYDELTPPDEEGGAGSAYVDHGVSVEQSAEQTFGDIMGMQVPEVSDDTLGDPTPEEYQRGGSARFRDRKRKGRVTPLTGEPR